MGPSAPQHTPNMLCAQKLLNLHRVGGHFNFALTLYSVKIHHDTETHTQMCLCFFSHFLILSEAARGSVQLHCPLSLEIFHYLTSHLTHLLVGRKNGFFSLALAYLSFRFSGLFKIQSTVVSTKTKLCFVYLKSLTQKQENNLQTIT